MAVLSPPVAGQSEEVKLASHKWRRLQKKFSHATSGILQVVDLDFALLKDTGESTLSTQKAASASFKLQKEACKKHMKLPVLSGLLLSTDVHGKSSAFAIIDGKRFKENDHVNGFKILKIHDDRVVISRAGQISILNAPDVQFNSVNISEHQNSSNP
jgi:hypothetical protein